MIIGGCVLFCVVVVVVMDMNRTDQPAPGNSTPPDSEQLLSRWLQRVHKKVRASLLLRKRAWVDA